MRSSISACSRPPVPTQRRSDSRTPAAQSGRRRALKLRFDDAHPGAVAPLPLRRLDRALGVPLHHPPHSSERCPAALGHPRLCRLDRFLAGGAPLRQCDLQRSRDRPAGRDRRRHADDRRASRGPELRARGRRLGLGRPLGGCRHHDPARRQDRAAGPNRGRGQRLVERAGEVDGNRRRRSLGHGSQRPRRSPSPRSESTAVRRSRRPAQASPRP